MDEITIVNAEVGVTTEYTACTPDSESAEEDLTYEWDVLYQNAADSLESYRASEVTHKTERVVKVKFLRKGTYTLRCLVKNKTKSEIGVFCENLPEKPALYEGFSYTACTPDTNIDPRYLEYLWVITRFDKDGKEEDGSPYVIMDGERARTLNIVFVRPGQYKVTCAVFSPFAKDVIQESHHCEVITGTYEIGDCSIVRGKNRRFGVVHPDNNLDAEFLNYKWECEGASIELANKRICRITFESYGEYEIKCTVSSEWAKDSPQVAVMKVTHEYSYPPETIYPNYKRKLVGARIFPDENEFLAHPVHGLNYNPNSQANRFWKIWLDDIGGYTKKICIVEEDGELVQEVYQYSIADVPERWAKVELYNIGSGNQFEDDHMDVRLYTMEKEEHPYDVMFVPIKRYFYVGVHRRNTKKLPFNIAIRLTEGYKNQMQIPTEERKYIMNLHDISPHW